MNTTMSTTAERYLVCELVGQYYAISIETVVELATLRDVRITSIPKTGPHVVGVVNLRGELLTVFDVRSMLGMKTIREETAEILEMLRNREKDHIEWLEELYASIRESRDFRLTTNPHLCKFGRWYDELRADHSALNRFANDDLTLLDVIASFDVPHQRIHSVAEQATQLVTAGASHEAIELINKTRETELQAMIMLFEKARNSISTLRRGVLVVIETASEKVGLIVDSASEVKRFSSDGCQSDEFLTGKDGLIKRLIHDEAAGNLIQVLNVEAVIRQGMRQEANAVALA